MQNGQSTHNCSTEINLGTPLVVVPKPSAHSVEEQDASLSPVAGYTEVADSPTAVVAGAGRELAVGPIAQDETSGERC